MSDPIPHLSIAQLLADHVLRTQRAPAFEQTNLTPDQEQTFQEWAKYMKIKDVDAPDSHYDYRGAYLAGIQPSANGHWPDTFKQHGHPTFSEQSKYSTGPGDGGTWRGETFIPAKRPLLP